MLHSQLKITFPDCPYIWDPVNIRETYKFKTEQIDIDSLIGYIQIHFDSDLENDYMNEMIDQLQRISDDDLQVFENKTCVRISQHIPRNKKNLLLNFHTTAYGDENGTLIDREFDSNLSWMIFPILGDLSVSDIGYVIDRSASMLKSNHDHDIAYDNDTARSLDPKTYKGVHDNEYEKTSCIVRSGRIGRRNFIVRDIEDKKQKQDIVVDTSIENMQTSNNQIIKPRFQQIELNNKTRASASLIRERLASSYKVHRIGKNPRLIQEQSKVDLSINRISRANAMNNNKNYRAHERNIYNEIGDYTFDKVGVRKTSAIYKFSPTDSGKIKINNIDDKNLEKVYFITILRHKKNLHITYHELFLE
jgi:hypothetical protein